MFECFDYAGESQHVLSQTPEGMRLSHISVPILEIGLVETLKHLSELWEPLQVF